jgi:mannose-6-phosphate isomerase-like protein (cupin superfamily)
MHVLKPPIENSFEKVGIKGKIYPSKELIGEHAGYVLIETETGHETTIIEHESIFTYYILEGSGYFEINDDREDCVTGDLVVIPKGAKFTYKGKLKMLLITTPAWREEQEETV